MNRNCRFFDCAISAIALTHSIIAINDLIQNMPPYFKFEIQKLKSSLIIRNYSQVQRILDTGLGMYSYEGLGTGGQGVWAYMNVGGQAGMWVSIVDKSLFQIFQRRVATRYK